MKDKKDEAVRAKDEQRISDSLNGFLPTDYGIPAARSNYMDLEEGENRFRILSSAVVGWEWWEEVEGNRKPRRVRTEQEVPQAVMRSDNKMNRAKHFWAFVVYNYANQSIQILELKQATLMRAIEAFVRNPKWGSPKYYDLVINKTKTGANPFDVEYNVMPEPKELVDSGILQTYEDMHIKLDALFTGEDPFNAGGQDVNIDEIPENLGER